MKVTATILPEVLIVEPAVHGDARGFFTESYNQRAFDAAVGAPVVFVQDNHSRSTRGVLRGLHYQLPPHAQGKLVRVVCGGLEEATADTGSESREGSYCLTTTTATRATPRIGRPGSVAERWARLVLKGCESPGDLRTLEDWATFAGVSYSSLRESCHLIGIQPHDARDLARVVRAVVRARRIGCSPEVLLDVSDSRTLSKLLARAGLGGDVRARGMTAAQLLDAQRFVPAHNAGLRVLALLLARAG